MNTQARGAGRWQEAFYVALALTGLAGTWAQALGYFNAGFIKGNISFWVETVVTPASTFITVDLLVLAAALFVWMFGEGRRLGIGTPWLWAYLLGSILIGISFALPLFLAHRHRLLRLRNPAEQASLRGADLIAIGLTTIVALAAAGYSLLHAHA